MGKYPRKQVYEYVRQAYLNGKFGKNETSVRFWSRAIERLIRGKR